MWVTTLGGSCTMCVCVSRTCGPGARVLGMHPPTGMPARGGPDLQYKTMKEFNMWLVGGNYVGMKRHAASSPVAPLPETESSNRLKMKVEEKKRRLKEEQRAARQGVARRDPRLQGKVPTTARVPMTFSPSNPDLQASGSSPLDASPRRPGTSPHAPDASPDARLLLKTSLIDSITHSNYISMFPPLFTPYDRHNHMLRGWDPTLKKSYDDSGDADANLQKSQPLSTAGPVQPTPASEPSGVKRPPARPKNPGKPGFYPTGSSVNAYRHYTNYRLALALEAKEKQQERAAKQPASLKQLLRAQNASSAREPQGGDASDLPIAMRRLSQSDTRGTGAVAADAAREAAGRPPGETPRVDLRTALDGINKAMLTELRCFARPPEMVEVVCNAMAVVLGRPTGWANAKKLLGSPNLIGELLAIDPTAVTREVRQQLELYVCRPNFTVENVNMSSRAAAILCGWVLGVYQASGT